MVIAFRELDESPLNTRAPLFVDVRARRDRTRDSASALPRGGGGGNFGVPGFIRNRSSRSRLLRMIFENIRPPEDPEGTLFLGIYGAIWLAL